MFFFVFVLEDVVVALDVVLHQLGVDHDADGAGHVGDGVFVARVEGQLRNSGATVLDVRNERVVNGRQQVLLDQAFDDIFAGWIRS